jgi:hypothetical protein
MRGNSLFTGFKQFYNILIYIINLRGKINESCRYAL